MAEGLNISVKEKKRQDGDGYDSNGTTSNSDTESTKLQAKFEGEKPPNNDVASAVIQEDNTEGDKENITSVGARKQVGTSARAVLSSQRDLRQQFRQLHSQELIRRILQSTVVIPNNLAKQQNTTESPGQDLQGCTGNYSVKNQETNKLNLDQEDKDHPSAQAEPTNSTCTDVTVANTGEESKDREPNKAIDSSVKTPQGALNVKDIDDSEDLTKLVTMQEPHSFVCSLCNTADTTSQSHKNHNQAQPPAKETESFQSTQDGSVISLTPPNSEEEQEKGDTAVQGVAPKSEAPEVARPPDVLQLSERLQQQPSHETLDEILKLLQSQTITPHRQSVKPIQQTNVPEQNLVAEGANDSVWKQQQQFAMIGAQPSLREKHSRQLADMKDYYESEMIKLRDQLEMLRGNLSVLQEAVPVKMLEAANHKLEARCNLMEEIAADLKTKYNRLGQNNQDLETTCNELRQANEALEMRCQLLLRSNGEFDERHTEVLNNSKILESKILHLNQANEMAVKSCKQLEDANMNFERTCRELEESKNKIEARYRKCKEENLKLSGDIRNLQVSLLGANKHTQELEENIASLQSEKGDWGLKLDASQKMSEATQKRYEELKAETEKKAAMCSKMEEQMGVLSSSLDAATKNKAELEKNAERDKELLKRLLVEYDALAKEHQHSKGTAESWAEQVNSSQDEVNSLRGTITKLIRRNTTLEDSLREALAQQIGSTYKPESTPPSLRKTWGSPVSLKTEQSGPGGNSSMLVDYDLPSRGPRTSSPAKSDHTHSGGLSGVSRITSTAVTPHKQPEMSVGKAYGTNGIKFEIPWDNPKPSPTRSTIKRNLEKSYTPEKPSSKSPGNLVVKKSDLVTRFDVVFEDSKSGEEVARSHTGRTSRNHGESPTSIFVSNSGTNVSETSPSQRLLSDAAEAALSALRTGRVTSHADWETSETMAAAARKRRERSRERRTASAGKTADESSDKRDEIVPKLERKFSTLTEERKRLESTLSRIPGHRITKRSKDDKAFLENRLDDVVKEIGSVRMQLRRHHAL